MMSTFSIGFSRPKKLNPLSWAIMKYMKTEFSHTYLVFTVPSTGQRVVYQANRHGVNCVSYDVFKATNIIVDEIEIVEQERQTEALRFCIDNLGNSYSMWALFAIVLNIKFGDGTKRFICSELVARALNLNIKYLDTVSPKQIKDYFL